MTNLNIKEIINKKSIPVLNSDIVSTINLSSSFGCICEKVFLRNKKILVIKAQKLINKVQYTSIYLEGKSLKNYNDKFDNLFPKIHYLEKDFFIMDWVENNNKIDENTEKDFATKLAKIHSFKGKMFGFDFNTPIGGIEQDCKYEKSWINFYKIKRLQMIYELINSKNPMPSDINNGIEKIINNIEKYIPESTNPSLVHGDLWGGNILFNNGKLAGLIDPAIQYAEPEFELSYLVFFNTVSDRFFEYYQDKIKLDRSFKKRSKIYELYHALLNVYLWDRNYINIVNNIIKKII